MNQRSRIILFAIVGVFVLVALTFPLWRPFFVTNAVDEAFPALTAAQRDAIRAMPEDQQQTLTTMAGENPEMAADTALAMLEADTPMDDTMPESPVVLASGTFNQFDPVHRGEGTATIYELPDGSRVLRLENFRVTNGPDLHVILARTAPASILEPMEAGYIDLGSLKGNVGNQNYDIPADANLADYAAIVVYCVPFGVNFTVAAFSGG